MSLGFYFTGGSSASSVLGGQISTTALTETEGALFPNVSLADATTGITHYACICIKNTGAETISNAGVYLSSVVSNANIYIAKGLTGKNSTTEQTIANNVTDPTGALVFQQPLYEYSPVSIGLLDPGDFYHLWLKRVLPASSPGSPEEYIIITGVEQ
jgi:hypothetical protein